MRNEDRRKESLWLWQAGAALLAAAGFVLLADSGPAGRIWAGWLFLAAAVLLLAGASRLRDRVIRPLEQLYQALSGSAPMDQLVQQAQEVPGLPGAVMEVAAGRIGEAERRMEQLQATADRQAQQTVRRQLTEELCRSALPQVLRDSPATAAFSLAGRVEEGQALSCTFYDYFFIDPGLLCIMVGQVPGDGITEALYMVVAQTTIRSRLRMGRSLVETMADVNTQLYDQGAKQSLCVLVGTLNTANGMFTYVNAGGALPLLMRNGERYEWLEAPVYAAIGMNENVSYRSQQLRLRQGDCLFLQTAGLGQTPGENGVPFQKQELRAVLNRSRSRAQAPEEILQFTADEAAAYCQRDEDRVGYAALMLEYRKGDKELAHCQVPAVPASAGEVTAFLKKRFEDNSIQRRAYARVAVMVDELFALCCRKCKEGGMVTVECGIAPDGQSVTVRMSAPLQGVNPVEDVQEGTEASAVEFIEDQTEYLIFKKGEEQDTVTAVCFLEEEPAAALV